MIGGTLYNLAHGNPCAVHVDSIEKKPLFHFHPRTTAFSTTTVCNLGCLNCQNRATSQDRPRLDRSPQFCDKNWVGNTFRATPSTSPNPTKRQEERP